MAFVDLSKYDNYFFDCDGVLWNGSETIPGSIATLQRLQDMGKNVFFVTNNASSSQKQIAGRIKQHGFDCQPKQVFSSGKATALYIQQRYPTIRKLFLVGQPPLKEELEEHGFTVIHSSSFTGPRIRDWEDLKLMRPDPEVEAVVVASQMSFTYQVACYASMCVQNGAKLIATNKDPYFYVSSEVRMIGGGTLVAFLETATDCQAEVTGKPNPFFMEWAHNSQHIDLHRTLMLGDMLETDIQFAHNAGIDSALILSGVSTAEEVDGSRWKPNYVLPSVAALISDR